MRKKYEVIARIAHEAHQAYCLHWPSIFLVVGIVLFVFGISGYRGSEAPAPDALSRSFNELSFSLYGYTGRAAHFPAEAQAEMAIGAGLIAIGIIGYRNKKVP